MKYSKYTNTETILNKVYRCHIVTTGNKVSIMEPFSLPMDPSKPIVMKTEPEVAVLFPESSLKDFLHDFDSWMEVIQLTQENPIIAEEYKKLLMLVSLLK